MQIHFNIPTKIPIIRGSVTENDRCTMAEQKVAKLSPKLIQTRAQNKFIHGIYLKLRALHTSISICQQLEHDGYSRDEINFIINEATRKLNAFRLTS